MEVVDFVRTVVETCWSDAPGVDRMASLVAADYVHHTPFGNGDFAAFRHGLDYVDSVFADRRYRVVHAVADGALVATYLTWTGTRRSDGSDVSGAGAYHCRVIDGLIAEDWDVFFPIS